MNVFNKTRITLIAVVLMVCFVGAVAADELQERQKQLQMTQKQAEHLQGKVTDAQHKVDSVSGKLQQIQAECDAAKTEYDQVQSKLTATENNIKSNADILAQAETRLTARTGILNKRVRDIYQHGQISYLDVLLGASDFNDFATRMDVLKRIVKNDVDLVTQVRGERTLILQKKTELENDRISILELQRIAADKKKMVDNRRQQQQRLLNRAINDRDMADQAYREQLETSRQIEQMIRNLKDGVGSAGGSGALMWPVRGPITSPFGYRTHPIFGSTMYHTGIDIGVDYNTPVAAADSGVVISAGWLGGYGNAVIVNHGNGLTTLYAHNTSLTVRVGQAVNKGQIIAYSGSTGYSTGPHVHFEVRQNGTPVNPCGYLP